MTEDARLGVWEGRSVEHWREAWGVPELLVFAIVGSTNDAARALAEAGAPAGTTVIADEQGAGRGRVGRRWFAPPGTGLLLSIVLRPRLAGDRAVAPGTIPLRVGLAVARAAERLAGVRLGLKWPNDIVAAGVGKVAGVLCEGSVTGEHAFLVVGIGVNVGQKEEDIPPEVRTAATSLRLLSGRQVSRAALAGAILEEIRAVAAAGAAPLDPAEVEAIRRRDVLLGRRLTIDGRPSGVGAGVASDGALLVREPTGRVAEVRAGTVRVLEDTTPGLRETYP